MNPYVAALIFICGIAGLFYLDRDKAIHTSKALWLPIIYLWIIGSRPISFWFGGNWWSDSANLQSDGNPIDVAIFALLLVCALAVVIHRWRRAFPLLGSNWPILLYFLFCLVSVIWSYQPDIAFKRWVKSIDDLAMVLVVVTDPQPAAAVRRLVSRVGFVALPLSLLLIKYFPLLGRGYDIDGTLENKGVATGKNMFGIILLVISLYTLWQVMTLWRSRGVPGRKRHLLAQGVLLAFGIMLFSMADSATSKGCFAIGAAFMLIANRPVIRKRPARLHALCAAIVLAAGTVFFIGGQASVAKAFGRTASLSGRTNIWAAVIPAVPDELIGAGYESFWMNPHNVQKFAQAQSMVGWYHPEQLNEAHNGFIEVYLNLGWIGVGIISCVLISGYLRGVAAFKRNPEAGRLVLAYIVASPIYNITEAGFRSLDPIWMFLLLAIVSSTAISSGVAWGPATRIPAAAPLRNAAKRNQQPAWVYGSR